MTNAQYNRLNVHVSDSNATVIRAAAQMIASWHRRDPAKRAARKDFYRSSIECHEAARNLFSFVVLGA